MTTQQTKSVEIVTKEIIGGVEYEVVSWKEVKVKAKPISENQFRDWLDSPSYRVR